MPAHRATLDRSLLASGAALYRNRLRRLDMLVRAVAAHAGTPGMFHYHFESKDAFGHGAAQRLHDEMFEWPGSGRARRRPVAVGCARRC